MSTVKIKSSVAEKTRNRIRSRGADRALYIFIYIVMVLFMLVTVLPMLNILANSLSSGKAVSAGKVLFWPVEFDLMAYRAVFTYRNFLSGLRNSVLYTAAGSFITLVMMMLTAYPLSRYELPFRRVISLLFIFTMYFGGGLIPSYLLMGELNLINSPLIMILPHVPVYQMIVARTYIQSSIPKELLETSVIDGCSDFRYFISVVLPLSKPILAVSTLFFVVGRWNSYFTAHIYLRDPKYHPLQLILRKVLLMAEVPLSEFASPEELQLKQSLADLLKYAFIVLAALPMFFVYPLVQKHFVKGMMLGSLKG